MPNSKQGLLIVMAGVLCFTHNIFSLDFTHGPYLIDQTETAVSLVWFTDVAAFSRVEYGQGGGFSTKVEALKHGYMDIGKRHHIRLTGLEPGKKYDYRCVSTQVTKFSPYNPEVGTPVTSPAASFTTFNKSKAEVSFYMTSDIQSDAGRFSGLLGLADWNAADFMVLGGDILSGIPNEAAIFSNMLDPCVATFAKTKPIVFVRGKGEMRGMLASSILDYLPNAGGETYYAFSHGPAQFFVFDGGEDKPDNTAEYKGISKSDEGRQQQQAWFQQYITANLTRLTQVPFKIALTHRSNPDLSNPVGWDALAKSAGLDLVIAGHTLTYAHTAPGGGKDYHTLVLGQGQLCKVTVSASQVGITVQDNTGGQVDTFTITK